MQKLRSSSKIFQNSNQYSANNKNENFDFNYSTNASNLLQSSSRNLDKSISIESQIDKIGISNKFTKPLKPLKEENFETKPTIDFYKAYCAELESTVEFLTENMIAKTEKLNELDKLQTENLELTRKMKMFTKIMTLARSDSNSCQDDLCLANKLKISDMKNKYDKLSKQNNNNKISKLILNE